jgi:hypothetical protein
MPFYARRGLIDFSPPYRPQIWNSVTTLTILQYPL